jgi:hypothetical protein
LLFVWSDTNSAASFSGDKRQGGGRAKIARPRRANGASQILCENPRALDAYQRLQLADLEGWYKALRERALMTIMRSVLCLAVGCFLIAVDVAALAQSPPGNLSPRDFDLACAVAAAADIGVSQNEQNIPRRDVAVRMFIFYLGRLSGRDDSKDSNAIAWGRVAELQQQAILHKYWIVVWACTIQKQSERRPSANFVKKSSASRPLKGAGVRLV